MKLLSLELGVSQMLCWALIVAKDLTLNDLIEDKYYQQSRREDLFGVVKHTVLMICTNASSARVKNVIHGD